MLNTHTRYLHENILDYTEELLQPLPMKLTVLCICVRVQKRMI